MREILQHYRNNLWALANLDKRYKKYHEIFIANENDIEFQEYLKTIFALNKIQVKDLLKYKLFTN